MAQETNDLILRQEFRQLVTDLEVQLMANTEQHEQILKVCTIEHVRAPGIYIRRVYIPAGTMIVGKLHATEHANIISQGACFVRTEFGPAELFNATTAPVSFVSPIGTKRIILAVTDTYWHTIHATSLEDPDEIEDIVISKSYDDLVRNFPELSLHLLEG